MRAMKNEKHLVTLAQKFADSIRLGDMTFEQESLSIQRNRNMGDRRLIVLRCDHSCKGV